MSLSSDSLHLQRFDGLKVFDIMHRINGPMGKRRRTFGHANAPTYPRPRDIQYQEKKLGYFLKKTIFWFPNDLVWWTIFLTAWVHSIFWDFKELFETAVSLKRKYQASEIISKTRFRNLRVAHQKKTCWSKTWKCPSAATPTGALILLELSGHYSSQIETR